MIQTFSGHRINPFAPDPEQIVVEDIAQALGNQCRFGGHCRHFYSVAQHSCLLADLVAEAGGDEADQMWALLHDAAEAYLVDLPHPLKHRTKLGAAFREAERSLQSVIVERFALCAEPPNRLKEIDSELLAAEKRALVAPGWEWPELLGVTAADIDIDAWPPEQATEEFTRRFDELERKREARGALSQERHRPRSP